MVYERGEDVFQEEPFAYCVIADNRSLVCDFCLRIANYKEDLKICSSCKVVHYCDKYCQKKGWRSHHRSECKFLKNMNWMELKGFDYILIIMIRVIQKLEHGGDKIYVELPGTYTVYTWCVVTQQYRVGKWN